MPPLPPPPRPLLLVAGLVLTTGVAMTFLGGWRTGVSWDETYHVFRLRNFLEHGWYLLDSDLDAGSPGEWEDQLYVYGPATTGLLHLWAVLWGAEGLGEVATTSHAYAVRHLGVALLGLVGVAATAGLARLLLRSWGWGLVAAAALVAVPTWTGHAMFNVKDVPVATGFTVLTLGVAVLCLLTPATGARRPGPAALLAGSGLVVAGAVLAVGTRPGIWPGLALVVGVGLLTRDRTRLAALLASAVLAGLLLVVLYPAAFGTPVTALLGSALSSSRYDGREGHWWYLPVYLLVELPTLLLVLGAVGTAVALRLVRRDDEDPRTRTVVPLLAAQGFALPLVAVLVESNLYTGIRQLLFAAPVLAVLVALAAATLLARPRGRLRPGLLVAGVCVALVAPVLVQAQLFPYNYAHSSVPAGLVSPHLAERNRHLEVQTDYWRTSVRELAPLIPRGGFVTCTPPIQGETFLPASAASRESCVTDPIGPLAPYEDQRGGSWPATPEEFLAVDTGTDFVGDNCERFADVTRRLHWRTVTMSYVARCDLVLQPYPEGGIELSGDGTGGEFLLGAWDVHRTRPGAGLSGGPAALGVTLPEELVGRELEVSGAQLGGGAMRLSANGTEVEVSTTSGSFRAVVPAPVAASLGGGRLLLEVRGSAPTGLRLRSLEIAVRADGAVVGAAADPPQ